MVEEGRTRGNGDREVLGEKALVGLLFPGDHAVGLITPDTTDEPTGRTDIARQQALEALGWESPIRLRYAARSFLRIYLATAFPGFSYHSRNLMLEATSILVLRHKGGHQDPSSYLGFYALLYQVAGDKEDMSASVAHVPSSEKEFRLAIEGLDPSPSTFRRDDPDSALRVVARDFRIAYNLPNSPCSHTRAVRFAQLDSPWASPLRRDTTWDSEDLRGRPPIPVRLQMVRKVLVQLGVVYLGKGLLEFPKGLPSTW